MQAEKIHNIPNHIAIIMDGNGRWAQKKHLPRILGHREGAKSVEKVIKGCLDIGVKVLTLYTFSTENWLRPEKEVNYLMSLFTQVLKSKQRMLLKIGVKLRISGSKKNLSEKLKKQISETVKMLAKNNKLTLNLAFNYGSRQEIVQAVNKIIKSGKKAVTESIFENYLQTKGLPDPDIIIRTSGEKRLSNFLLWQASYSELYFTDVLWPDFKEQHLYKAIEDYAMRKRKFGGL